MKPMSPLSRSTPGLALVVAFSVLVLLTAVHIAGAQQQSPLPQAPSRPPRDAWDILSQIAAPVGTLVALLIAIITISYSVRSWKWTYFTKEWSALLQFVQPQARFMNSSLNADYKTHFIGDDAMKYEMIARLCIGYLDDLYFLRSKSHIRTWFRGSVKLLAGTHRKWLEDHQDSYDKRFYHFIVSELNR